MKCHKIPLTSQNA